MNARALAAAAVSASVLVVAAGCWDFDSDARTFCAKEGNENREGCAQYRDAGASDAGTSEDGGAVEDSGTPEDAGSVDAGDAGDPTLVQAVRFARHLTGSQIFEVPDDWSAVAVEVFLPDAGGSFTEIPVTYVDAGLVEFHAPSEAPYTLHLFNDAGASMFIVTDSRQVDLGYPTGGRPGVVYAPDAGAPQLDLTGVAPWKAGDYFVVFSPSTAEYAFLAPTPPPSTGSVSVTGPANFLSFQHPGMHALYQPDAGDEVLLMQYRNVTLPDGGPYLRTVAGGPATPNAPSDADGGDLYAGALSTPDAGQVTAGFDWAALQSMNALQLPDASVGNAAVEVRPIIQGAAFGVVMHATVAPDAGPSTYSYTAPLPSNWVLSILFQSVSHVPFTLNGNTGSLDAYALHTAALDQVSLTWTPAVTPAATFTFDGLSYRDGGTLTRTPLVSWTAGTGDVPNVWRLTVFRLNGTQPIGITNIFTAETSIRMPPGVLQSGDDYLFLLEAGHYVGAASASAPTREYDSLDVADLASAPFKVQ